LKILWLITARSGSKSIPDKNIKLLNGKPLLAYRIESALRLKRESEIWLSTDSTVYAELGARLGAKVPFSRPSHLSSDNASSIDVVLHAMEYANKQNLSFDFIGLLEPTSPFITDIQLEMALQQLINDADAEAIVAVKESRPNTFFIQTHTKYLSVLADRFLNRANLGRQNFDTEITPSGGFYISKWQSFLQKKTFYTSKTIPFLVDDIAALEIDEPIDWEFAEFYLNKNNKQINNEL
jgi:CMP-N,N'-diacetyllegionaminic acid synthase